MPWRGIDTENSVIRGSNRKRRKPPFWIISNLSEIFKNYMKQEKQSFCVTIIKREKDRTQPIIPHMVYLIKVYMSFFS